MQVTFLNDFLRFEMYRVLVVQLKNDTLWHWKYAYVVLLVIEQQKGLWKRYHRNKIIGEIKVNLKMENLPTSAESVCCWLDANHLHKLFI